MYHKKKDKPLSEDNKDAFGSPYVKSMSIHIEDNPFSDKGETLDTTIDQA